MYNVAYLCCYRSVKLLFSLLSIPIFHSLFFDLSLSTHHTLTHTHTHIHASFLSRAVERLDLEQGRWVSVEPMLSCRSTLGVAVLNNQLYAVGGFDGNAWLDTVERYNPGEEEEGEK